MADKVEVSKIVINAGKRPLELSINDARDLYKSLKELFGDNSGAPIYWAFPPIYVSPSAPWPNPNVGPTWICTTSGASARLEWSSKEEAQ